MTKTETRQLQRRIWKLSITRRKKTKEYRETMALLRMGQILELRQIRKLADSGSGEYAKNLGDLATLLLDGITKELRKI